MCYITINNKATINFILSSILHDQPRCEAEKGCKAGTPARRVVLFTLQHLPAAVLAATATAEDQARDWHDDNEEYTNDKADDETRREINKL